MGFHAHNNLGLSVANSLAALEVGARILDGTARGFGAGAGNAPLELVVAAIFLAARNLVPAIDGVRALAPGADFGPGDVNRLSLAGRHPDTSLERG